MILSTCFHSQTLISSVRTTSQSGLRILPSPQPFFRPPSFRPSSLGIEVADVINLDDTEMSGNLQVTEENIEDIQIVVQER